MKTAKTLIIAVLILGLGAAGFTACRCNRHAVALDYASEVLDLTDSQREDVKQIQAEVKQQIQAMREQKNAMRDSLKVQIAADRMDRDKVRQMVAAHREQMTGIIDLVVDRLVAFHETLTPKQKEKLIKKIETFESWHAPRS